MKTQWFVSTDMIGKPGVSPKTAGPFSTRDDAFAARRALEAMGANLSVFEEEVEAPVEFPSEPTLGWVIFHDGSARMGMIWQDAKWDHPWIDQGWSNRWGKPSAFVPAIAVPTSALDELREVALDETRSPAIALYNFLAAVDAAGDPS